MTQASPKSKSKAAAKRADRRQGNFPVDASRRLAQQWHVQLNGELVRIGNNLEELMEYTQMYCSRMNLVNLSTALHRLARHTMQKNVDKQVIAGDRRLFVILHYVKLRLQEQEHPVDDSMHLGDKLPRALATIGWSLAQVQTQDRNLHTAAAEIMLQIERMACGTRQHRPSDADQGASSSGQESHCWGAMNQLELANLLWALAKYQVGSTLPFKQAEPHIYGMMAKFSPVKLAMLAQAYAQMQVQETDVLAALATQFMRLLDDEFASAGSNSTASSSGQESTTTQQQQARPQEIANMAWALATRQAGMKRILTRLGCWGADRLGDFKNIELTCLAWSISKGGVSHPPFFTQVQRFFSEHPETISRLHPQGLANLLWAMAKQITLGTNPVFLREMALALAPACQRALRSRWYKPQEYSSVMWAIVKLGFEAGQHAEIDGIVETCASFDDAFLQELTPHGITSVIYAVMMFCNSGKDLELYQSFASRICDKAVGQFNKFSLADLAHLYDTICSSRESTIIDQEFVNRLLQEVRDVVAASASYDCLENLITEIPGLSSRARRELCVAIDDGLSHREGAHPAGGRLASAFLQRVFHDDNRRDKESSDAGGLRTTHHRSASPVQGFSFDMHDTEPSAPAATFTAADDDSRPLFLPSDQNLLQADEGLRTFPSPQLDYREPPDLMVRNSAASFGRENEWSFLAPADMQRSFLAPADMRRAQAAFQSAAAADDPRTLLQTYSASSSSASWQVGNAVESFRNQPQVQRLIEKRSRAARSQTMPASLSTDDLLQEEILFSTGPGVRDYPEFMRRNQEPIRGYPSLGTTTTVGGWSSSTPQVSIGIPRLFPRAAGSIPEIPQRTRFVQDPFQEWTQSRPAHILGVSPPGVSPPGVLSQDARLPYQPRRPQEPAPAWVGPSSQPASSDDRGGLLFAHGHGSGALTLRGQRPPHASTSAQSQPLSMIIRNISPPMGHSSTYPGPMPMVQFANQSDDDGSASLTSVVRFSF